jgi:hypothetical protein
MFASQVNKKFVQVAAFVAFVYLTVHLIHAWNSDSLTQLEPQSNTATSPKVDLPKQSDHFKESKNTELDQVRCEFLPEVPNKKLEVLRDVLIPDEPTVNLIDAWLKPDAPRFGPAVAEIPEVLKNEYTFNGKIEVTSFFCDQAYLGGDALVTDWTLDVGPFPYLHILIFRSKND